jgi:hypothetical protein
VSGFARTCAGVWLVALAACFVHALAQAKPPLVPEALLDACIKKQLGAPCSVTLGGQTKAGACAKLPDNSLACMPANARPPKRR